jgi:hypothetical protein
MIEKLVLERLCEAEGKSIKDIASILYTSSYQVLSHIKKYGINKRSRSESLYRKYNPLGDPFVLQKIDTLEKAKLLGLGLGLYWGEGNKKNKNSIRLGNTNPLIIVMFIRFLVDVFDINLQKLRFGLQIFSDISENEALYFWIAQLNQFNISENQFFKVTITPARGIGTYREKSQYGVLTVYYSNSKLKRLLDSMLPM